MLELKIFKQAPTYAGYCK